MDLNNPPIFIIGTERSGSNLLRLILNTHSQIDVPHPPHIMHYMAHLEEYYDDLNKEDNFQRLVEDVLALIQAHIYPWDDIPLNAQEIAQNTLKRDTQKSTFSVFFEVYEQHRKHNKKQRWGCKSTFMIEHADEILQQCPNAKFIWLVRDPRDVAASSLISIFNPFSPYHTAELWNKQQQKGYALKQQRPDQVFELKYENLIATPEQCIRKLCEFLQVPFEPEMKEFHKTPEALKGSNLSKSWSNTRKPILKNNAGRFKALLNERQIQDVEIAAAEMMATLNYQPVQSPVSSKQLSSYRRLVHIYESLYLGLFSECRSLFRDKNYPLRWKRRIFLFTLKSRLLARHFQEYFTIRPVQAILQTPSKLTLSIKKPISKPPCRTSFSDTTPTQFAMTPFSLRAYMHKLMARLKIPLR